MATPILPALGFHFKVEFMLNGAKIEMQFMEVSGLEASLDMETYSESGENKFSYQLPLRTKFSNLVLKRGISSKDNENLISWSIDAIYNFVFKPIPVTVMLMQKKEGSSAEAESETIKKWEFVGALPVKIQHTGLNAMQSEIVIETLELAYSYSRP